MNSLNEQQILALSDNNGTVKDVLRLLEDGMEPDAVDENGWSALQWAVSSGDYDKCELLVSKGADVNYQDSDGNTALMKAILDKKSDICNLLINAGADVNLVDDNDCSCLHHAAHNNMIDDVEMLISHGANIDAVDCMGMTPLHVASIRGNAEIVRMLLSSGASLEALNDNDDNPIHCAAASNDFETVKVLVEAGANVNAAENGISPLMMAVEVGNEEIALYLVEHGADATFVRHDCWTVLHAAAVMRMKRLCRVLVEKGANPMAIALNGLTPLAVAMREHLYDIALIIRGGHVPEEYMEKINKLIENERHA